MLLLCILLSPLQYALYKKMTQAAILIQSKFRSYYEQKKFQQSRRAAVLIQKYYRSYKKCGKRRQARRTAVIVQQKLRWVRRCPAQEMPGLVGKAALCGHPGLAAPRALHHFPSGPLSALWVSVAALVWPMGSSPFSSFSLYLPPSCFDVSAQFQPGSEFGRTRVSAPP